MWKTLLAAAVMAGTMVMGAAPSQAQALQEVKAKGSLKIGVMVDFPPYGIMNEKNEPDGYDPAVAKMLADHLGVKAEIVPVTSTNRIPFLQSNQLDMLIASLAITEERAKQIDFSKPYAALDVVIYGRTDKKMGSFADLKGVRVGVSRGGTPDRAVTEGAPEGTTIQRFEDSSASIHALMSDQVDAIALGARVIEEVDRVAPAGKFEVKFRIFRQLHGIALRKGQDDLLAAVNAFIDETTASGKLNEVHQKWLASPLANFSE